MHLLLSLAALLQCAAHGDLEHGSCDMRFHHRCSRLFGRWADLMSEVIVEELEVGSFCQG